MPVERRGREVGGVGVISPLSSPFSPTQPQQRGTSFISHLFCDAKEEGEKSPISRPHIFPPPNLSSSKDELIGG